MKSEKKEKFIWTAKVGDKGQIVIPKEAREIFNINSGDSLILFGDIKKGIAISKYDNYLAFMEEIFDKGNKDNK
ncbi:MAG: AbrB/MazE/SpoVT family DNA-binding domain-containing protein [Clostridia bacterium]